VSISSRAGTDRRTTRSQHDPRARYLGVVAELARRGTDAGGRQVMPYIAARVSLGNVAQAMGKSRASLYKLWPTQHDFWVDLTMYLVYQNDFSQHREEMPWRVARANHDRTPRPPTGETVDALRVGGNIAQEVVLNDIWVIVRAALLGYPAVPGFAALRQQVEEIRLRDLAAQTNQVLDVMGHAAIKPFDAYDIAVAMWCFSDGVAIANRFLPDVAGIQLTLDDGEGSLDWGMISYASRTALIGMTAPADDFDVSAAALGSGPDEASWPPIPSIDPNARWTLRQRDALAVAADTFLASLQPAHGGSEELIVPEHLSVARVARAAGVSRQAIYDVWPTPTEMMLDLFHHVRSAQRANLMRAFDVAFAARHTPPLDLVERIVELAMGHADDSADPRLTFLPDAANPHVQRVFRAGHEQFVGALCDRVDHLLGGQPLRDGVELTHVATLWAALLEGGRRMRRTNPSALRSGSAREGRHSTIGAAARALFEHSVDEAGAAPIGRVAP